MPKFAGSTYVPWTIDADQIGGVDVEQAMTPAPGDVLAYDSVADEWQPTSISGAGGVPLSRTISTTAPLTGGGDLSANRTLAVSTFGAGSSGVVPASGGGSTNYLRADGTWAAPPGTGVTSVGASAPVTSTGGLTPTIGISDFTSVSRGTVPASGGGTTNFLRADGTWTAPGGGTPVTSVSGAAPISSSGGTTPTISLDDNGVSNAKLRDSGALSVIGRSANSTGDPADISAVAASGAVLRESGSTLGFGQVATAGIADNAVTLAKLATQANNTVLGNVSGGAAVPSALTQTQLTALVNAFTSVLSGAVPASGGGTTNFLRADGTWTTPPSGSDPWTYVVLGSDFVTSSGTAVNVTGLLFTPAASTSYDVRGQFLLRTAAAATGPRPGCSWPSGLTDGVVSFTVTSGAGTNVLQNGNFNAAVLSPVGGLPNTTQSYPAQMQATIIAGGSPSGNFQIQLASETGGTNVTMKAGSWIAYRAI